jgi:hypothetical protein
MFIIPQIEKTLALVHLAKQPRPLTRKRKILKAELLYLPFYIFTIHVESTKKGTSSEQVCIDGIQGQFAFFKGGNFVKKNPAKSRVYDFIISQNEAEKSALEDYKRELLKQSLRKKVDATVKTIQFDKEIFYPYWIGYFHRKGALDFEAIDAISTERQGAKMRPIFVNVLLQKKTHSK